MTQPKGAIVFKILVTAIFTVIGGVILGSVIACAVGLICKSGGGGGGGGNSSSVTLTSDQCLSTPNACGQSTIGTYTYTCPTFPQGSPDSYTLIPPCQSDSTCTNSPGSVCYVRHTGSTDEGTSYAVDGNGNYVSVPATQTCNATPPDNSSCPAATIGVSGFYATPSTVGISGKTTLHWESSNSDGCSIAGDNGYSYSGAPSGSVDITGLTQTVTYTLTCTAGTGGTSATKSIRVIVNPHYKEI